MGGFKGGKGGFGKGGGFGGGGFGGGKGDIGGGGAPASEELVNKVKNIQKMPGGHDLWKAFISRIGGGPADPALRVDWELSEFLTEADPQGTASPLAPPKGKGGKGDKGKGDKGKKGNGPSPGDMMGDMMAMMESMFGSGGGGGGKGGKGWGGGGGGNSFEQAMSEMFEWMMNAMKGGGKGGDKGGKGSKDGGTGNPELDALVARVKAVQRMEGGKDLWHRYVERIGGTMHDPARRQVSELQAFLAEADPEGNTIGAVSKGKGKGRGDWWGDGGWNEWEKEKERMPKYVASSAEHANLIARVKAIQKKQGNEGWSVFCDKMGGFQRDPASRTIAELEAFLMESDPDGSTVGIQGEFDEFLYLKLQIKNGNRHSEQFKELWEKFCDERMNGLRDPSRHSIDTLREFVSMAPDVPIPETDPEHRNLVDKIKQGQRSDESFKQAWWAFCEGSGSKMMDPSRHEKSFLESFLASVGSVGSYGKAPQPALPAPGNSGPY